MTTTTNLPKTTCLTADLSKALAATAKVVPAKSTLPILGNVRLQAADRLYITGTNLELALTTTCSAHSSTPWDVTLPAKTLTDLVALLPEDIVELTYFAKTESVTLRSGAFVTTLKGLSIDEFPVVPTVGAGDFTLPAELLTDAFKRVLFATGDEDRPVLAGVLIVSEASLLTFVAADGFRLAEYKLVAPANLPEFKLIVPALACTRLLPQLVEEEPVRITVFKDGDGKATQIGFACGLTELISQLVEGNYPDYTNILPKASTLQTQFPMNEFRQACKAADIIARDNAHTLRLTVQAEHDDKKAGHLPAGLALFSTSAALGEHRSFIPARVTGEPLAIAFNAKYLLDGLNAMGSDDVEFVLNTPTTPGVLRPVGANNYQVVLMPMAVGK